MKRHIVSLLILILAARSLSFAGIVPVERARQTAATFFNAAEVSTRAARPDDFRLLGTFPESDTRSAGEAPAMYVFERTSGGYAIVSADDVARPVLAYSLNASFPSWSEIPDNMMATLRWYAGIIEFARSRQWEPSPGTRGDAGLDPSNTVQLKTAQWSQDSPFNDLVKEINGKKPPIGCVATSIAIVMKYHRWPDRGIGVLPAYDFTSGGVKYHVDGITLGHTYNWDLMPDNYRNCSKEEATQLARLLYDVAVMSGMSFNPGGSEAGTGSALKLTEYFDYDKSMFFTGRAQYRVSEWENLIKKDIDDGLPVIYSGFTESGGHAFVIDGYNGRYFSLNYGWGGGYSSRPGHDNTSTWNNFFTLSPIEGHEEDLLVFNEAQDAVFHIMPEKGNPAGIESLYSYKGPYVPYNYRNGMPFSLDSRIVNSSQREITREFRYVLFDSKGKIKQLVSPGEVLTVTRGKSVFYKGKDCRINVEIEEGDRICMAALGDDSKSWVPLPALRSDQIVFTRRPLTELVEIGYDKGYKYPFYNSFWWDLTLYVRMYKDLCFIITRNGEKNPFIILDKLSYTHDWSDYSLYGHMVDESDIENDIAELRIGLPSGSYTIHLLNPATGEKMDIDLEV